MSSNTDLESIQDQFNSEVWEIRLQAAESLVGINTEQSLSFLREQLNSSNNWKRNAAALALMETRDQEFFLPILNRIIQLGPKADISTLVFALENFDCSRYLSRILQFHIQGSATVRMSTTTILMSQKFKIYPQEKLKIKGYIKSKSDLKKMGINYAVIYDGT
jgi:hypothetical protein